MKVADLDIIIIPGHENSGRDHWQSRWEQRLSTARRVEQDAWSKPVREDWVSRVADTVNSAGKPVLLIAHSLGIPTAIHAIPQFKKRVAGAFLVAPPDVDNPKIQPKHFTAFGPYPRDPLPFPSILVGSRSDHYCDYDVAEDLAAAWGAMFVDGGESGHLNEASGHGPWPEGTMVFAKFVSQLK